MFVEFQTVTKQILDAFRFAFREQTGRIALGPFPRGKPDFVVEPFQPGKPDIWLSKVEAPATTSLEVKTEQVHLKTQDVLGATIEGQALWIEQPLDLVFVRLTGTTLTEHPVSAHLSVRLRLLLGANDLKIRFDQSKVEFPSGVPAMLVPATEGCKIFVEAWLQIETGIPLGPLTLSKKGNVTIANVGAATPDDKSMIAIRAEVGFPPATTGAWEAFYAGDIPVRHGLEGRTGFQAQAWQNPWAHFVERGVVESTVIDFVQTGMSKNADLKLNSGIDALWNFTADGDAGIHVDLSFKKPNACSCFGFDVDIKADFDLDLAFKVLNDNELTLEGSYGYDITNDAAKDCCLVTATLAWPFLGKDDLGKLKMNRLEWFVGLMQGPIILAMGLDARFSNQQLKVSDLGESCATSELWKFTCTENFSLGSGPQLIKLRDLRGIAEGLVLLGEQVIIPTLDRPKFAANSGGFCWEISKSDCNHVGPGALAARLSNPLAFYSSKTFIWVTNPASGPLPTLPLIVHDAHVIADPLNIFSVGKPLGWDNFDAIEVRAGLPPASYFTNPYPCTVLLQTSWGVHLVSVAPPPKPARSEAEVRQELENDFYHAVNNCMSISDPLARLKIKTVWLVNPPPEQLAPRTRHLWQVVVRAEELGYGVEAVDAQDRVLASANAVTRGMVQLSFLNAANEMELRMARSRSAGGEAQAERRTRPANGQERVESFMRLTQQNLLESWVLELGSQVRQLLPLAVRGRQMVAAIGPGGLTVYDLSVGGMPLLAREATMENAAGGALGLQNSLLIWGEEGLARFSHNGGIFAQREQLVDHPVRALVRAREGWAALTDRGVEFLNAAFVSRGSIAHPGRDARRLWSAGPHLLAVRADGSAAILYAGSQEWEPLGGVDAPLLWEDSAPVEFAGKEMLFVPARDVGGAVVDVASGSRLGIVARYSDDPWFWRSARLEDKLTVLDRHGKVAIYTMGDEHVLTNARPIDVAEPLFEWPDMLVHHHEPDCG